MTTRISSFPSILPLLAATFALLMNENAHSAEGVRFSQSADEVDRYDYVEVTIAVKRPRATNPFTDVAVEGEFCRAGGKPVKVKGFCDSQDGSIFRIRFMPTQAGEHRYSVTYCQGTVEIQHEGKFLAREAKRRGLVRVDREHPWHFVWEGTGEHYFWNGTTTYFIMGWDDTIIRKALDRLHRLKVNRVRVVINGRVKDGRAWFENVYPTDKFSFLLNPWVAARPESVESPGFDVTRFNVAHWQKYDWLLRHARELDMIVSVVFHVDGRRPGVDPFGKKGMGGEDEQRYYRYAVARFAALSNVMWDVTNEYQLFRDEAWANKMGALIKRWDPYDHLASVHGHREFPFRTSEWADFAMHQVWDDAGGYQFLRDCRAKQTKAVRPIPQVNEEYGYEDHYPRWGGNKKWPARVADNRRRLAWSMYMAGGYQTTGERADTWGPDTGGGWINGRGDDSMVMLEGYGRIVDFFTSIPWWTLEPDDDLIEVRRGPPVRTSPTHIVYTRDKDGQATLYVNGKPTTTAKIGGDVKWDAGFRLALANELTRDRPWLGDYHRVAIHDHVLSAEEAARRFKMGLGEKPSDALVLYTFRERGGTEVKDVAGKGKPLNLRIETPDAAQWLPNGGLRIKTATLLASAGPAGKITEAIRRSQSFALEAWVSPANATQGGPARIVTLSKDPGSRSFTLGQAAAAYEVRFRTTTTSANGEPSLWSPGRSEADAPVYASSSPVGDLAVVYLRNGGEFAVKPDRLVAGLKAQWYNPRDGAWKPASTTERGTYQTSDAEDWVLLLSNR